MNKRHILAFCPECWVERTDYEGLGKHLPECPNCLSEAEPQLGEWWEGAWHKSAARGPVSNERAEQLANEIRLRFLDLNQRAQADDWPKIADELAALTLSVLREQAEKIERLREVAKASGEHIVHLCDDDDCPFDALIAAAAPREET